MEQSMETILQVKNLGKSFYTRGSEVKIFANVSFEVKAGETILIKGRSGVGKSTMLGVISGLDRQTTGSVSFMNQKLEDLSLAQLAELRANSIGLIFQSFNLISSWTASENVEAVLLHRGIPAKVRAAKAQDILEKLGLKDRLNNYPTELSVGQQQRVAVARTLVNGPALILADEPTGDVDHETAEEIMQLIMPRVKEGKAALVVASHGAFDAKYANRVMLLRDGGLTPDNASDSEENVG